MILYTALVDEGSNLTRFGEVVGLYWAIIEGGIIVFSTSGGF